MIITEYIYTKKVVVCDLIIKTCIKVLEQIRKQIMLTLIKLKWLKVLKAIMGCTH